MPGKASTDGLYRKFPAHCFFVGKDTRKIHRLIGSVETFLYQLERFFALLYGPVPGVDHPVHTLRTGQV